MDLFEKIKNSAKNTLGQYKELGRGYYMFPKLTGELGPNMKFRGKDVLTWSLNNYLGLANHPEVRKADAEAAAKWGMAYPMGARMMTGETDYHNELEQKLATFVGKESGYLLNYGYQGMISVIDALVDRNDVIVYDSEAHACIMDGLRLHMGKRFVYQHNDMASCEKMLERATKLAEKQNGSILVITEGVYGMLGDLGKLDEIVALKQKFQFRLMIDDAHGFGTMGANGRGTHEHFNVIDGVDLYFGTFAKSMAGIGGFIAGEQAIIDYLRHNLRSQIYAKSLPMPMVIGALKRLELLQTQPQLRENLWKIVKALQTGLRKNDCDLGCTQSPVTPVFFSGNVVHATNVLIDLRENYSIFCSVVVYPVVPKNVIMLRLIPTAEHTLADVERTVKAFAEVNEKLKQGKYDGEKITKIDW